MSEVLKNVAYRVSSASAHLTFPRVAQKLSSSIAAAAPFLVKKSGSMPFSMASLDFAFSYRVLILGKNIVLYVTYHPPRFTPFPLNVFQSLNCEAFGMEPRPFFLSL